MKTASEKTATLRSSASTLLSLNSRIRQKTLPEFTGPGNKTEPLLPLRANLFASYLFKLLTPRQPGEATNYLPHYQPNPNTASLKLSELDLGNSAHPYHQVDPKSLNDPFSHKRTQNLGALIGLNLFMAADFNDHSLGLASSPNTGDVFFTQKLSSCWSSYFQETALMPLLRNDLNTSIAASIAHLCSKNQAWWTATGIQSDANDIHHTMVYEWFEVSLRLFLTPETFLVFMLETIVGTEPNAIAFKCHVMKELSLFKQTFFSTLSTAQQASWHTMIQDNGFLYYKRYLKEISTFHMYNLGQINHLLFNQIEQLMLHRAMLLEIPHLDDPQILSQIEYCFNRAEQVITFNYLLKQLSLHWPQLNHDKHYFLWSVMENITHRLTYPTGCFTERQDKYHGYFLLKSIEFHKNNTARFFIRDIPSHVINEPFPTDLCELEEHKAMVGHSLLHFSLQNKNAAVVNLLYSKGARLLPHELDMLPVLKAMRPRSLSSFFSQERLEDAPKSLTQSTMPDAHR